MEVSAIYNGDRERLGVVLAEMLYGASRHWHQNDAAAPAAARITMNETSYGELHFLSQSGQSGQSEQLRVPKICIRRMCPLLCIVGLSLY